MRNKLSYRITLFVLLLASLFILTRLLPTLTNPGYIPIDDFVRYWAGGRLNFTGENPYDPQNIERMQTIAGGQDSETDVVSIMLNPPWAMSIVIPLGWVSYPISRLAWLLLSIALLLLCTQFLWKFYSDSTHRRWLAWIAVFIFAPTISLLEKGQITILVLVGIVGFIYYVEYRNNDWAAGAFLAFLTIKPQVIYIFWIALLFWVTQQRRWKILISAGISILILTLVATVFNPHVIQQYLSAMLTYQTSEWATPTIGAYIRLFWLGTDKFWPQYLPALFGGVWFIFYWYKHRVSWSWLKELPTLLLVSVLTAPYIWTYDLVVLIPAIILATIWLVHDWKRWSTYLLVGMFFVISIIDLVLHMKLSDFWFVWMAPALLIWYLLVKWNVSTPKAIYSSE